MAEMNPKEPDWVYCFGGRRGGKKVNWKTYETKQVAADPEPAVDRCLSYCPERNSFFAFPPSGNINEYHLDKDAWTVHKPEGDRPKTHAKAVRYDSLNKAFVCFNEDHVFYYSPFGNRWYKIEGSVDLGESDKGGFGREHIYSPVDNAHIMVGGKGWTTYAYRLCSKPGELPGTGGK